MIQTIVLSKISPLAPDTLLTGAEAASNVNFLKVMIIQLTQQRNGGSGTQKAAEMSAAWKWITQKCVRMLQVLRDDRWMNLLYLSVMACLFMQNHANGISFLQ